MRGERSQPAARRPAASFSTRARLSAKTRRRSPRLPATHCHSIGYRTHIVRCDVTLRRSAVIAHDATCARGGSHRSNSSGFPTVVVPEIRSRRICKVRQNQRIIAFDDCDPPLIAAFIANLFKSRRRLEAEILFLIITTSP